MDIDSLLNYGIDYEKGLKNCMGNAVFYKKILSMFLQDQCFSKAKDAFRSKNRSELFSRMHELKGISGNAALFKLYEASVPLVELLRKNTGDDSEIESLFAVVDAAYGRACTGIGIIMAEL